MKHHLEIDGPNETLANVKAAINAKLPESRVSSTFHNRLIVYLHPLDMSRGVDLIEAVCIASGVACRRNDSRVFTSDNTWTGVQVR